MLIINDWNEHFETNESRKLKRLLWVKFPNQHDSLAFRTIAAHKRGLEIFGAWVLMVQVASKKKKEMRGNIPESPDELGIITGYPPESFKFAIEVLKSPKIGWISQSPDTSGENPDTSGKSPGTPPVELGRDGVKGVELEEVGNGGKPRKTSFEKPTWEELTAYIQEKGFRVNARKWLSYYESNGWKVGKSSMKNWKAAVVTWEENEK